MQIIESFLCGKENNKKTCEDGIYIGEHLVAVIDGVTAKGHRLWDGHKSGYYAKELLMNYLKQKDVEKQSPLELLNNLDNVLCEAVLVCETPLDQEEYLRASVIIYNDYYKEIWNYGDCQCSINDMIYTHSKKIDEVNAKLRAGYLEEVLEKGATIEELLINDCGRSMIQENLLKQFAYENKKSEYGYPILNGMGIEPDMVQIYKVKEGDEVILASDGYPQLGKNLEECESKLEKLIKEDPLCFRQHQSTKGIKKGNVSFDDRAFCRIVVSDQ
ncbi:MAG: hypothetical protein IKW08_09985 [Roseburia sp.]|nr:hypothetical protein [Roseburia sp.]